MAARFPVSPEPLPLVEVSPQVMERVPSREKVDRENPQIFPIYKYRIFFPLFMRKAKRSAFKMVWRYTPEAP